MRFPDAPADALAFLVSHAKGNRADRECLAKMDTTALRADARNWGYVINPGGDLTNTESRLR